MSDDVADDRTPGEDPGGVETPRDVPPVSAEELVAGEHDPARDEERRYPSTLGGACYLVFLVGVVAGLLVVVLAEWRTGVRIMGGSLLGAAAARLVLRARDAGMLAVRNKPVDALVLVVVGLAMVFLAGSIPNQPGT